MLRTNAEPAGGARRGALTIFGLATVAFWSSYAVLPELIPPLVPLPDLSAMLTGIEPWIRETSPFLSQPDGVILDSLRREVVWAFARLWLVIGAGVLAGALIVRRAPAGRWLAIVLGVVHLARFVLSQVRLATAGNLVEYWAAIARLAEPTFFRHAVDLTFLSATVVFLTRRPVAALFERPGPGPGKA